MPPTTGYSFGDIVLVPFPFTDQSAAPARRPYISKVEHQNKVTPKPLAKVKAALK